MRMLNFYINRAGKNLPATRLRALERAKNILSGIIAEQKHPIRTMRKRAA
jgi:tRNA(adenine34) deaminase